MFTNSPATICSFEMYASCGSPLPQVTGKFCHAGMAPWLRVSPWAVTGRALRRPRIATVCQAHIHRKKNLIWTLFAAHQRCRHRIRQLVLAVFIFCRCIWVVWMCACLRSKWYSSSGGGGWNSPPEKQLSSALAERGLFHKTDFHPRQPTAHHRPIKRSTSMSA